MSPVHQGRLLYIAFPFPPSRGAGVYRSVAVANYLASIGWEVTVLAPEEGYFLRYQGSEDRSLLKWISRDVRVTRVRLTNWLREDDLSRMSLTRALAPESMNRLMRTATRYLAPLDYYPFWFAPALREGIRLSIRRPFDVIMATGNPFSSFAVAFALGKLFKVPYVLDYRDAWTFDQFTGNIKPVASDTALAMERRFLHAAAGVTTVNAPIEAWLRENHGLPRRVRTSVVENGYDREFIAKRRRRARSGEAIRFLHVGTLIPDKMDWGSRLAEFDRTAALVDDRIRLDMYGHLGFSTAQEVKLRHLFESGGRVAYHGPVEKSEVADLYQGADVLYLPLYDSPYVTSGKVYEMMATGKPILAWGGEQAGALQPLRGYPKLVRADTRNPRSWVRAVSASIALSKVESPELDLLTRQYAKRYERYERLKPLSSLLRSISRAASR